MPVATHDVSRRLSCSHLASPLRHPHPSRPVLCHPNMPSPHRTPCHLVQVTSAMACSNPTTSGGALRSIFALRQVGMTIFHTKQTPHLRKLVSNHSWNPGIHLMTYIPNRITPIWKIWTWLELAMFLHCSWPRTIRLINIQLL